MMKYRYVLDPSSNKYICPKCKQKRFVRYIDTETNSFLHKTVGRCDREINCSYHKTPREFFNEMGISKTFKKEEKRRGFERNKIIENYDVISQEIVKKTLRMGYHNNNFISFLRTIFSTDIVKGLIQRFYIGTTNYWEGATVFWQCDLLGWFRTGKVILYDKFSGNRVKSPFNHITWIHKIPKFNENVRQFKLRQCLFGEHQLLSEKLNKTIAVVESEKTAIIMTGIFPNYTWMACGGASNLSERILKPLKEKRIVLYPDLKCYNSWTIIAQKLRKSGYEIVVSDLIEKSASENDKNEGYDIADFFIADLLQSKKSPKNMQHNINDPIRKMILKNPVLVTLINEFDLISEETGNSFKTAA